MHRLRVDVTALAFEGKGVARHERRVVFVPRAAPGDRVDVRVVRDRKSFLEAELERVVAPGSARREPPCPCWADCGGCHLMHVDEAAQREAKRGFVRDALARIAKVPLEPDPVAAAPAMAGYRQRATLRARVDGGRAVLGFLRRETHEVVDVPHCMVLAPALARAVARFRAELEQAAPAIGAGELRIDAVADADDRASLSVFGAARDRATLAAIAQRLTAEGMLVEVRDEQGRRIAAPDPAARLAYRLKLPSGRVLEYRFAPGAFTQINFEQNEKLVSNVLALAGPGPFARTLDLYSGIGNHALPLSFVSGEVVGVESSPAAVESARENAARMGVANARFECTTAARGMRDLVERGERFDLVLLNPTRAGAEGIGNELVALGAPRLVYVSCNPPTLARDIAVLAAGGYRLERVVPLDLFPQTYHVESVALLTRTSAKGAAGR